MSDDLLRRAFRDVTTARLATIGLDGAPHVAPLWFVWLDDAIYLSTRQGSTTWENAERDARVALVIDRGREWIEQSGVQVQGRAVLMPAEHPDMRASMSAWHEKYRPLFAGDGFERFVEATPSLGFLRVTLGSVRAWDHATEGFVAGPGGRA